MTDVRELHPVTFFAKDERKPATTKDFRPKMTVLTDEVPVEVVAALEPVVPTPVSLVKPLPARLPARD